MTYPYRIFLSYARADKDLVQRVAEILADLGMEPLWDVNIQAGKPFTAEIKEMISRAHLFMPVMSVNALTRPWVHQEIGFAIALNLPILPLSIGQLPDQMIAGHQSLYIHEDLSNLEQAIRSTRLDLLVIPPEPKPIGLLTIIQSPEDRAKKIGELCTWLIDSMGAYGMVRIQARYSTFAIPTASIRDSIWDVREGNRKRTDAHRRVLREERLATERHARKAGCKLMIDHNAPIGADRDNEARRVRLSMLVEFMRSMSDNQLKVVLSPRAQDTNLQIVGDHFLAEAVGHRAEGYVNTIINAHAPTVLRKVSEFDRLFDELHAENPMTLAQVIAIIEQSMG